VSLLTADVFIKINTEVTALMYLCFNRVREAAMTSLMEVTLLLVQSEAELINANMYAACTGFVSYLSQLYSSP